MNILKTTDRSRYGNDCYINETVSLVEQFGMYAVITCRKVTGWSEEETICVQHVSSDYKAAKKAYHDCEGT